MSEEKSPGLFDYINDITHGKKDIYRNSDRKNYNKFMVNRALSQFVDCIFFANEMNMNSHIDTDMHHDFLFHVISSKKRFAKWPKSSVSKELKLIMEYYGYSERQAKQVEDLFDKNDFVQLKQKLEKGGLKRK